MRVLITGGDSGQLKWELTRTVPAGIELVSYGADRLDITDQKKVAAVMQKLQPEYVINAAAYTAVDQAETEKTAAYAVNHIGVRILCEESLAVGASLIHVSTDFVFGSSHGSPFLVNSPTNPVSIYGQSKLAGEQVVAQLMPDTGLIIRTAWVYSSFGNNFVKTMLRLMRERDSIGVIADQVGSPTWANSLAQAIWHAASAGTTGVHHWTDAGVASWYDLAVAIYEEGQALGLLDKATEIKALRTDQYPTPAQRPTYSVMDTTHTAEALDFPPKHWRVELRQMMRELV